jgi:hypothetical protein
MKTRQILKSVHYKGHRIDITQSSDSFNALAYLGAELKACAAAGLTEGASIAINKIKTKIDGKLFIDLSFLGSPAQIREQHRKNALTLSEMYQKAKTSGKRVNGYSEAQLLKMYQNSFDLSK